MVTSSEEKKFFLKEHLRERSKERFGLVLNNQAEKAIIHLIGTGRARFVRPSVGRRVVWEVYACKSISHKLPDRLMVVYDRDLKQIVTAWDDSKEKPEEV